MALLEDEYQPESGEEAGKKRRVCARNIEGMSAEPVSHVGGELLFRSDGAALGNP